MIRVCVGLVMLSSPLAVGGGLVPPPEPRVAPMIALELECDGDWNHLGDSIDERLVEARRRLAGNDRAETNGEAEKMLEEMVEVELIFSRQIRQEEIDQFLALGGEIDHIFQAISYGWQGRIPLVGASEAARTLGDELVVIREHLPIKPTLQSVTTQMGVRPYWSLRSDGSYGYKEGPTGTIAFLDTGIDHDHRDLINFSGEDGFWKDYTAEGLTVPRDPDGHGTFIASVALGTAMFQGLPKGEDITVRYTKSGTIGSSHGTLTPWSPLVFRGNRDYTAAVSSFWLGGGTGTVGFNGLPVGSLLEDPLTQWQVSPNATLSVASGPFTMGLSEPVVAQPFIELSEGAGSGPYAQRVVIDDYHRPDDELPAYAGVAPGARWAMFRVFTSEGVGTTAAFNAALDDILVMREELDIRVVNMSLTVAVHGTEISTVVKVNTLAMNGVVPVVAAENVDGWSMRAPALSGYALTVGSVNSMNQLTDYTKSGSRPRTSELPIVDWKPDILAPGGSRYFGQVLAADSNDGDAAGSLPDIARDDLTLGMGTSVSAAAVSGAVLILIDAMERNGHEWDFESSASVDKVKLLLATTASETLQPREVGGGPDPIHQRGTIFLHDLPAGKDRYEGYGFMNLDGAIQALEQRIPYGYSDGILLHHTSAAPRVWAARVPLFAGHPFTATLTFPPIQDLDMYLFSTTPAEFGNSRRLKASGTPTSGTGLASESVAYMPEEFGEGLLVVKWISGRDTPYPSTLTIGPGPPYSDSVWLE